MDRMGSPRIALAERKKALERTTSGDARIDMYFIDPVYADQLKTNIADYTADDGHGRVTVINGTYENTVPKILSTIAGANVFLYVDPFGIKNLGNRIFAEVCKSLDGSVELLYTPQNKPSKFWSEDKGKIVLVNCTCAWRKCAETF